MSHDEEHRIDLPFAYEVESLGAEALLDDVTAISSPQHTPVVVDVGPARVKLNPLGDDLGLIGRRCRQCGASVLRIDRRCDGRRMVRPASPRLHRPRVESAETAATIPYPARRRRARCLLASAITPSSTTGGVSSTTSGENTVDSARVELRVGGGRMPTPPGEHLVALFSVSSVGPGTVWRAVGQGDGHLAPPTNDAIIISIMIDVKLDRNDRRDLYQQVAAEIRRAIGEVEAAPGERLPPAKDLAAVLGVNPNTVLRARSPCLNRTTGGGASRGARQRGARGLGDAGTSGAAGLTRRSRRACRGTPRGPSSRARAARGRCSRVR